MRNTKRLLVCLAALVLVLGALFALSSCGDDGSTHDWKEATCLAPKTCKVCGETEGEALGHVGGTDTCATGAKCERCGVSYGTKLEHDWQAADCTQPKHCKNCDAKEGAPLGHTGGNATCGQQAVCTRCGNGYGEFAPVHNWVNATCTQPKHCTNCKETVGKPLGHADANKDHKCENGCSEVIGTHADSDKDHDCDYCGEAGFGTCADENKDHACDYGCDKEYGFHADENKDHACDYGCAVAFGTHADGNTDHKCDYCGKGEDGEFGAHADANKDHKCDYCGESGFGACSDENKDHACDYGCSEFQGVHADSATDEDHVCDHGCGAVLEDCGDTDKDHECDHGCDKPFGTHADGNTDHKCDYCGKGEDGEFGAHADANKDHKCDYCAEGGFGACTDENKDHACDYGCSEFQGVHADSATDNDHTCDYGCGAVLESCLDADQDHACDNGCDKTYGTHADSAEDTDHVCDYCGEDETLEACEDIDKDHKCDNGCDKTFGEHADSAEDTDHVCDWGCGAVLEDHKGGEATCQASAVCSVCGVSYGALAGHSFTAKVEAPAYLKAKGDCTTAATYYYSCSVCGEKEGNDEHIFSGAAALGHSFGAWRVETTEEGNKHVRSCTVPDCGESEEGACGFDASIVENNLGCAASCLKPAKCSVCGNEYGEKLDHAWDDGAVTTPADCENAGVKTFTCTRDDCGAEKTEAIAPIGHKWNAGTVTTPATCTVAGVKTFVCENGTCGAQKTEPVAAKGHTPGAAATCETAQTCTECGEVIALATGHSYAKTTTPATCTTAQVDRYSCACGDRYEETVGSPIDHDFEGASPTAVLVEGKTCEYYQYYKCNACHEDILYTDEEGNVAIVTNHKSWTAALKEGCAATCVKKGTKILTCDECGTTKEEAIPVDTVLGHAWDAGVTENGVTTYTCQNEGCGKTKTAKVVTSEDKLSGDDLKNELEVNDTKFELDEGVQGVIGDQEISVNSGTISDQERAEMENNPALKEQLEQVGNNPIYNFTITDSEGGTISQFGENNYITVTVPYTPDMGDDLDAIAIWFIDDDGNITSIPAVYNDGFVTFKTNHFSKYTVTKLLPWQRCEVYGHSSTYKTVRPTCVADGFRLEYCVRCGYSEQHFDEDLKALDHDYDCVTVPATCETAGKSTYTCDRCDNAYEVILPALNHKFEEVSHEKATCDAPGLICYECVNDGCDASYETVLAQLEHEMTETVTPATCEAGGYTTHSCKNCTYSYTDTLTAATGHDLETNMLWWDEEGKEAQGNPNNGKYDHVTVTLTCKNCDYEKELTDDEIDVTTELVYPTCEDKGHKKFRVRFTNNGKVYEYLVKDETFFDYFGHLFGDAFNKHDDENHWQQCVCGEIREGTLAPHAFDEGIVTKAATCTAEGEKTYTCACGYTKTETIEKVAHTFVGAFMNDENGHWQLCSVCRTASEKAEHAFGKARVTKAATCAEDGEKVSRCACGFEMTEVIPATGNHIYDASDIRFDENGHWFVCRTCLGVCEASEHTLVIDITKAPTCTEKGEQSSYCDCGYRTENEELDALGHSFGAEDLTYDESGHWFVCTVCFEACDFAEHELHAVETKAPTCTEAGELTTLCDCGYVASVTVLEALGHSLEGATFAYDENGHWMICAVCSETFGNAEHTEDTLVDETKPTCTEEGEKTVLCRCGHTYTVVIPNLGGAHTFDENAYTFNDEQHYNECSVCGEHLNYADHAYGEPVITEAPTCAKEGKSVATCVCGKTHEEILPINDNHAPDEKMSFNKDGHWTLCLACGASLGEEAHTFGEPTVSKAPTCAEEGESVAVCVCGCEQTAKIPATGEHTPGEEVQSNLFKHWYICTVCGEKCGEEAHSFVGGFCEICNAQESVSVETPDSFYVNLLNTYKNITGAAIRIEGLSLVVKENGVLEGSISQLDVAELMLYVEDGVLKGAAKGGISIYNGPFRYETAYYSVEALIEGDVAYVLLKGGRTPDEETLMQTFSVDALLDMLTQDGMQMDDAMLETVLSFVNDTLVPTVDLLIAANADGVESTLKNAIGMLFSTVKAEDGTYVFTLDYDRLHHLNENLYNLTVPAFIDLYFGEGTFDLLVSAAKTLVNKTMADIPAMVESQGIDLDALIEDLNAFYAAMGAPADFDIGEIINDPEYAEVKLGLLLFGEESFEEMLDSFVRSLSEATVYGLIAPEMEQNVFEAVGQMIDMVKDALTLGFVADAEGTVTDLVIEVKDFATVIEDQDVSFGGRIEIGYNQKIEVTWTDIVESIKNAIVTPPEEMTEEKVDICEYYEEDKMEYNGEYYRTNTTVIRLSKTDFARLLGYTIMPDCTGWTYFSAIYGEAEAEYAAHVLFTEDGKMAYMLFENRASGEIVEMRQTPEGVTAVYEDGTEKAISFEVAQDYLALIEAVFGEIDFVASDVSDLDFVDYYYNAESNAFATESQHDYEMTVEVLGDRCEEDGIRYTYTCTICGDTVVETRYWCEREEAVLDLSTVGGCGGTVSYVYCPDCGTVYSVGEMRPACKIGENDVVIEKLEGGMRQTVTCPDCGLVFVMESFTEKINDCVCVEYSNVYITDKDGASVLAFEDSYTRESHAYTTEYILNGESCENGYTVREYCTVCGETFREWQSGGHRYIYMGVDPSEFGACAGGKMEIQVCQICDALGYVEYFEPVCKVELTKGEFADEMGVVHTYMEGTCPDCGISYYLEYFTVWTSPCTYEETQKIVMTKDGATVIDSERVSFSSNHNWVQEYLPYGESCDDGWRYTESCTSCGQEGWSYEGKGHRPESFSMDLASLGACGGYIKGERCAICEQIYAIHDANFACSFQNVQGSYVDGNGIQHQTMTQTCPSCGLVTEADVTVVVESECTTVYTSTATVTLGGETLFTFNQREEQSKHDIVASYTLLGKDCKEGYLVNEYCTRCEYTASYQSYGHRTESVQLSLAELGMCGGYIYSDHCSICDQTINSRIEDYNCNWYGEGTSDEGAELYRCNRCGVLRATNYVTYPSIEPCRYDYEQSTVYSFDGVIIFESVNTGSGYNHKFEWTFELYGETCEDGYRGEGACVNCDMRSYSDNWSHSTWTLFTQSSVEGCQGHAVEVRGCACGKYLELIYNADTFTETEAGVFSCEGCGLKVYDINNEVKDGCTVSVSRSILIMLGEEALYSASLESSSVIHTYAVNGFETVDGRPVLSLACSACGAANEQTLYAAELVFDETLSRYYYDLTVTPEEDTLYTILSYTQGDTFVALLEQTEDGLVEITSNDDGRDYNNFLLTETLMAGRTYVYRMYFLSNSPGTILYSLIAGETEIPYRCEHGEDAFDTYVIYNTESEDCSEGYIAYEYCTRCGYFVNSRNGFGHETNTHYEYFDQLGMCGGYYNYEVCRLCDKVTYRGFWDGACGWSFVEENEAGESVYHCASCDTFKYYYSYVSEKDESCNAYHMDVARYEKNGEQLYLAERMSGSTTVHDYETIYEMFGYGCGDGYRVTRTCKDCGDTSSYEDWGHYTDGEIRVEFADHGACGSGYAYKYVCVICEKDTYYYVNDGYCAWETVSSDNSVTVYRCVTCGTVKSSTRTVGEKNENCIAETVVSLTYANAEGEIFFSGSEYFTTDLHVYEQSFELNGDSCTDGYTYRITCKDCDYLEEGENASHNQYTIFRAYDLEGVCDYHKESVYISKCPCGQEMSCNYPGMNWEEGVYYCAECDLRFSDSTDFEYEGCESYRTITYTVMLGEQTAFETSGVATYEYHDYAITAAVKAENGTDTVVSLACSKCGAAKTETIRVATPTTLDTGATVCEIPFTAEREGYRFVFESYTYSVYLYRVLEDGTLSRVDSGSGSSLNFWVNPGESYVVRINRSTDLRYMVLPADNDGEPCNHEPMDQKILPEGVSDCTEGALSLNVCRCCGMTSPWGGTAFRFYTSHDTFTKSIDLAQYGVCSGSLSITTCACGSRQNYSTYFGCNYEYASEYYKDENGKTCMKETYTCKDCGMVAEKDIYAEIANCMRKVYHDLTITVGEESFVLKRIGASSETLHDYVYEPTFENGGSTCNAGVSVAVSCKNCDYTATRTYTSHSTFEQARVYLSDFGACSMNDYITINNCACGSNFSYRRYNYNCSMSSNTETVEIDGKTVTTVTKGCATCGIVIVDSTAVYVEGCERIEERTLLLNAGENEYKFSNTKRSSAHDFSDASIGLLDGGYSVKAICSKCSAEVASDLRMAVLENHDGIYYYDFTFSPEVDGTYTIRGKASGDSYVHLYLVAEDGTLTQLSSNDDGAGNGQFLLSYKLEAGKTYTYRIRFYSQSNGGTIPYLFGEGTSLAVTPNCSHANKAEVKKLAEGAESCEDGVVTGTICRDCGSLISMSESKEHRSTLVERIELADLSACGGYLEFYACVCGEVRSVNYSANCYLTTTTETYLGEDGIYRTKRERTCATCGLVIVDETYTLREDCVRYTLRDLSFTVGETVIFEDTGLQQSASAADHALEYAYAFKDGENCENGVTVTISCTECDYTSTEERSSHVRDAKVYYVGDFGACGSTGTVTFRSCACGYNTSFDYSTSCSFQTKNESVEDEQGVSHSIYTRTCTKCGMTIVRDRYNETNGCDNVVYDLYTVSFGETVVAENLKHVYSRSKQHVYGAPTFTFITEDENCNSGVTLHYQCTRCDDGYDQTRYYHSSELMEAVDLHAELGACEDTKLFYYTCPCGFEQSLSVSHGCSFTTETVTEKGADGKMHRIETLTCSECSLVYTVDTYTRVSGCYFENVSDYGFAIGDNALDYEAIVVYRMDAHEYEHEFTFDGEEICESGVKAITTCKNCDYRSESHYESHVGFATDTQFLFELGACNPNCYLTVYRCACGEEAEMYLNNSCAQIGTFEYPEAGEDGISHEIYTRKCQTCGLTNIRDSYTLPGEGCWKNNYYEYTAKLGDETLATGIKDLYHSWEDHTYGAPTYAFDSDKNCESGVTLTFTCEKCGYSYDERRGYHGEDLIARVDLTEEYGACAGAYYLYYACPCEKFKSFDLYLNNCEWSSEQERYSTADGMNYLKNTYSCAKCGLTHEELRYAANDEKCVRYQMRDSVLYYDGTKIFTCKSERLDGYRTSTNHDYEYTYTFKDQSNKTCTAGVTVVRTCKDCGATDTYERTSHTRDMIDRVWLFDFGACNLYSYYTIYSCACGYSAYADTNSLCGSLHSGDDYYDDDENRHHTSVRECSYCGLRMDSDTYTVRDRSTCTQTTYYRVSITFGATLAGNWQYSDTVGLHDYRVTGFDLAEGATSCEAGVTVTYTCVDCSDSYQTFTKSHQKFEIARYDLRDEENGGALCHGDLVELTCACGKLHEMQFDTTCEISTHYSISVWVENTVHGPNPLAGYFSNNISQSATRRTCAVTDPEQCGYSVAYATYWLAGENECKAYQYQTWLLGYDTVTGEYAKEITFATGYSTIYHPYEITSLAESHENGRTKVSGTHYECPLCGSYAFTKNVYNENGTRIEFERYAENKLNNGETKISHTHEQYDPTSYEQTLNYNRTVYADGRETVTHYEYIIDPQRGRLITLSYTVETSGYWKKYEYSYNFEDTCEVTVHITDSQGSDDTTTNERHSTYYVYEKLPGCTQFGYYDEICVYCQALVREHVEHAPYDHNWNWNASEQIYCCSRCGIENINGASGDVVMEDLTPILGGGENYVVGYWDRTQTSFLYYVSLILHTPMEDGNDEVVLAEIEITELENVSALAFSRAAVLAAAEALGYAADEYDVRISFVPYGADGSFDYAVTFSDIYLDASEAVIADGTLGFELTGYEVKEITITPVESGVFTFVSFSCFDTVAELYDANGNQIDYNDDGAGNMQFRLTRTLNAGETYVLKVRPHNENANQGSNPVYVKISFQNN